MITSFVFPILLLLIGLIAGFFFGQMLKQKEIHPLREKAEQKQQELALTTAEKQTLKSALDAQSEKALRAETQLATMKEMESAYKQLQTDYLNSQKFLASLETKLRQAEQALEIQKAEIRNMQEQNRVEFKNLANEILTQKEKVFAESNEKNMQQLLTPLRDQLGDFKKKIEEVYIAESKERHTLESEIRRLVETSTKVGQEANNLTNALKTNVKKQGNWGELILETILSNSGLTKGNEFVLQEFIRDKAGNIIKDSEGNGLQPDAMIFYPDERKVIADSKVSLIAWERYVNAEDPDEQKQALEDHIRSMYAHIDNLSGKNYPKYAKALDYVLLFVPIEPAFLEALKADRNLWKYAYDKGIVMVSPTNLLAVLKIIADLWKVEIQSKNAIEIARKAGDLYDKFHGFMKNFEAIGKKLDESKDAFQDAFKQLGTGRGNIITRISELKKMGVTTTKQLSDDLIKFGEEGDAADHSPE